MYKLSSTIVNSYIQTVQTSQKQIQPTFEPLLSKVLVLLLLSTLHFVLTPIEKMLITGHIFNAYQDVLSFY